MLSLGLMACSLCVPAQSSSSGISEQTVIQHAKNLLTSTLDSRLPRIPLEYFLAYETNGTQGKWVVTECGKQSNNVAGNPKRKAVLCVKADYELEGGDILTLLIAFDGVKDGQIGDAMILRLTLAEVTGAVRPIRSLWDVPVELHRVPSRVPSRMPRDIPPPARDS